MLLLAKLAAILIMVWFYLSAKDHAEPGVKWAIIGLVGYWITWWLADFLILDMLVKIFSKGSIWIFLVTQIPVLCGIATAIIVRNKLIKDIK
jgi:hypothetical protein